MAGSLTARDIALPPLREDLQIVRGGSSYSGAPTWIVLDPLRNRFFRVSYELFQLLSVWNRARTGDDLKRLVAGCFGRDVERDELASALNMLDASFLLAAPLSGSWRRLHAAAGPRHSLFMRAVHNYLFFKVPLVRPHKFLAATWPLVSPLFSRLFVIVTIIAGALGLYLVSHQWDAFRGTFSYMFSLEGAAISIASIVLIKSLHELGHGYVAYRYGCRVPTMGVAMMVLMPLLYTDVSDAWRLRSRRRRIAIDSAGMLVELAIAAYALLLWSFLPDGPLRSAVFVIATVGWVLSIAININPFMRFDGYYILADAVGVENLQPRAFRHMRWRLRELLFGLDMPPPEHFPRRLDVFLTLYAVATAIYRLILYVGIALLVYHFFIKLVGIGLFAVEVAFFILRPVWSELKEWHAMRTEILASRKTYVSLALAGLVLLALFVPLSSRVSAPAILQPETFARLYPAEAGRIETVFVRRGQDVAAGDALFVISSPAIAEKLAMTEVEMALVETRLARIGATKEDRIASGTLSRQRAALSSKRDGLNAEREKLVVRAPFPGRVVDLNPAAHEGRWISPNEQLAYLAGGPAVVASGYVAGDNRSRVESDAQATFIPDDVSRQPVVMQVANISSFGVHTLDMPALASPHGGAVAAHVGKGGEFTPANAEYLVRTRPIEPGQGVDQTMRGVLLISATPESVAAKVWRNVGRLVMRELGL